MNVLLGATLAGKTTLMRLMAGLDQPTTGRVLVDGKDINRRSRAPPLGGDGLISSSSITPRFSVYENIASPLRVAGLVPAEIDARVRRAADAAGLEPLLQRMPASMSGGQQQRTAIARALVKRADLVLLDEPLGQSRLQAARGTARGTAADLRRRPAPSWFTRRPSRPRRCCSAARPRRCGRAGSRSSGRPLTVYRTPDNIDAARVFSDPPLNELSVDKQGGSVVTAIGRQLPAVGCSPAFPTARYTAGLSRRCRGDRAARGPACAELPGQVAVTEISGSESFVHVDVGARHLGLPGRGRARLAARREVGVSHRSRGRAFVFDSTAGASPARTRPAGGRRHDPHHARRHRPCLRRQPRSEADYQLKPLHHVWEQGWPTRCSDLPAAARRRC